MSEYGFWDSWLAVILAAVGTFVWRFGGVVLASKIPPHSLLMDWVNAMAYAMVASVLMLMLAYPTGILAASGLDDRLLGLVTGVAAMVLSKRIILSLLCGILMFAASLHLF
jgi:fumarate reductase subunit D